MKRLHELTQYSLSSLVANSDTGFTDIPVTDVERVNVTQG